jgi:hypothetical protein
MHTYTTYFVQEALMRFRALSLFVCIGFAAPAYSQTATQNATGRPADAYSYFKRALTEVHVGREDAKIRRHGTFVPLTSCNEASEYIGYDGKRSSIVEKIANLAYDVLYMQAVLQVAGYPTSIWSPDLDKYERENLAGIRQFQWGVVVMEKGTPAKQKLAKKLNDYKKSSKGQYKDVIPEAEGCGGGEVSVEIRTSPSAQRVQYINLIKYNLCVFQGLDPRGDSCDLWADYGAPRGDGVLMAGNYKVRAIWSDGTAVYRDLKVDDLAENKNGNMAFIVTKR